MGKQLCVEQSEELRVVEHRLDNFVQLRKTIDVRIAELEAERGILRGVN